MLWHQKSDIKGSIQVACFNSVHFTIELGKKLNASVGKIKQIKEILRNRFLFTIIYTGHQCCVHIYI